MSGLEMRNSFIFVIMLYNIKKYLVVLINTIKYFFD